MSAVSLSFVVASPLSTTIAGMPSRKKAKGKARRAAKAKAEVKEAKESQSVATNQQEEASLEGLIKRLKINAANSPEKCKHSYPPSSQG